MMGSLFSHLERMLGPDQIDGLAVAPKDIDALAGTMRMIAAEGGKAGIIGGGTSPMPEGPKEAIRVSLARLSGVREVNPGDFIVVAGAGTVVDDAVRAAEDERLLLPLDITSGDRATVGGAYMTAAIGPYAAGYGPFRDSVLGAKCVTATGEIVRFGGRTMKNVTGYEITRFLAGSRGLFAVAAELTLKVLPMPERRGVVIGRFGSEGDPFGVGAAVEAAGGVKACELIVESGLGGEVIAGVLIEGMDTVVSRGMGIVREIMERAGAQSVTVEATETFRERRRSAARTFIRTGMVTIQVPPPATAPLLRGFRMAFAGMPMLAHPLIGRIHVVADEASAAAIRDRVLAVGGKRPVAWAHEYLAGRFTPAERAIIRALKKELDPGNVLNSRVELEQDI